MANPAQASFAALYGPAQVRLAELGAELLRREREGLDTRPLEESLNDLGLGLEKLARATDPRAVATISGHLIERYGLLAVGTDPLLRGQLPPIPATGAIIIRRVLGIGGAAVQANAALIGLGAMLRPIGEPAPVQPGDDDEETVPDDGNSTLPGGGSTWPFTSQSSVTVNHNLGRFAQVQVFDMQGQEIDASVTDSTFNSVTVSFSQPLSGHILIL